MSYLVLARKYRPGRFEDVVAQEHVTKTLANALKNNRVGSGYLFCGPRGTGKTTIARILAKAVNCAEGPTTEPCNKCTACTEITSGSSLDVLEIDAASNTGVDDIRSLRENVRYLPTNGKFRIYIIDEVHRLSAAAFDALLKTLEEPPPHVIFMMATTEPLKVPDTILSRTQRFDLKRVSTDDLVKHLKRIAESEKFNFTDSALKLLARKGDGSVRDSLSLMDQIAAFAGENITDQDVINGLGLVDGQFLFDFVDAIGSADSGRILTLVKNLFDSGVDTADFVTELLEHMRSLMILSSSPESAGLLNLNSDEIKILQTQADLFSTGDILLLIKTLSELHTNLKFGLDERLLLETAALKMTLMESTVKLEEILSHLGGESSSDALKKKPGNSRSIKLVAPSNPQQPNQPQSETQTDSPITSKSISEVSTPVVEETVAQEDSKDDNREVVDLDELRNGWKGFVSNLRKRSPMLATYLPVGVVKSLDNNILNIALPSADEAMIRLIQEQKNKKMIDETLSEYFNVNLTVAIEIDNTSQISIDSEKNKVKKIDPLELINSSPNLKRLIDRVDGEIIGIKKIES